MFFFIILDTNDDNVFHWMCVIITQKKESSDEVTRLTVWVKSRTKKDGSAVNTDAAVKIVSHFFLWSCIVRFHYTLPYTHKSDIYQDKANEFIRSDAPSSSSSNPKEDTLAQILGPDNPGRLRAMGRGMSMTKLACFQMKSKYVTQMQQTQVQLQQQVNELQDALAKLNSNVSVYV